MRTFEGAKSRRAASRQTSDGWPYGPLRICGPTVRVVQHPPEWAGVDTGDLLVCRHRRPSLVREFPDRRPRRPCSGSGAYSSLRSGLDRNRAECPRLLDQLDRARAGVLKNRLRLKPSLPGDRIRLTAGVPQVIVVRIGAEDRKPETNISTVELIDPVEHRGEVLQLDLRDRRQRP